MASVENEKLVKHVSDAISSSRLSEGTTTQLEIKEQCPSIETSRTSENSEDAIKVASQKFEEVCISPNLEPRTMMQKVKDFFTFERAWSVRQVTFLIIFLAALIVRLYIAKQEVLAEFCLFCLSSIVCIVITMYYDRGYYAQSVFEDSHPRKAFVDSPEKLPKTRLKSTASSYAKFKSTSSTSGYARALVHPPPLNMPDSPIAMAAYSEPDALPGSSGQQKSP